MSSSDSDSFRDVFERLRSGDNVALTQVFDRYAERLVALARSRLDQRLRQRVDAEDVLQSVLRTFFVRVAGGQFSVRDWDSLWGLLVCITVRKCTRTRERNRAARRDVRRETTDATQTPGDPGEWTFIDPAPGPDAALLVEEALDQAMHGLTEQERQIILLSLQGEAPSAVAGQLGGSERKVYRVLQLVRKRLERLRDMGSL